MKKFGYVRNNGLIFLIVAIVLYIIIFGFIDFNKIYSNLNNFSLNYIPIIFGLLTFNIFVLGFRFHFLLKKIGIKINFFQSLLVNMAGHSLAFTPAGSGSIIKSHIIKKIIGSSYSLTSPIIVFEKWLEFVSIVLVIAILLIWSNYIESQIVVIIGGILVSISILILKNSRFLKLFNKTLKMLKLSRFTVTVEEFSLSIKKITNLKIGLVSLMLTLLTKLSGIFMIYFIFKSFNIDLGIFNAGQIYFTSALIGVLTFLPGGIIVTESSMIGLLLKQNVEFSLASLAVIISRVIGMWIPMMIGLISMKILNKKIGSQN